MSGWSTVPRRPEVDVYAGADLASAAKVAPLSGLFVRGCLRLRGGARRRHCTIAASDLLAKIKATVFTATPAPSDAGAQLRVYHLSADTPAVHVLNAAGGDINAALDGLAYPNATGYLTLPAAS